MLSTVKPFSESVADLNRDEIFMLFRGAGYTMTEFAQELNVYPSAISQWFSGKTTSERIDAAARRKAAEFMKKRRAKAGDQ